MLTWTWSYEKEWRQASSLAAILTSFSAIDTHSWLPSAGLISGLKRAMILQCNRPQVAFSVQMHHGGKTSGTCKTCVEHHLGLVVRTASAGLPMM